MQEPQLAIRLLGPWDVRLAGEPITTFEYAKVRALLAILVVEAGRPLSRDYLCALLWPDRPARSARQNLSQALAQLRRALGDRPRDTSLILATTDAVQLDPDILRLEAQRLSVDVWRFTALIDASERHHHLEWHLCTPCAIRLREAAGLYRGDFLDQLFLDDSRPFEEWAETQRRTLRRQWLTALERLMRYTEWRGENTQAIAFARHLVDAEPWLEGNQRELMRLLAVSGQRSAALSHFAELRQSLRTELNADPEPATISLARAIEDDNRAFLVSRTQTAPDRLPVPPTTLIGRETILEAALARIRDEGGRLLTLCGPAGVGKTRLALELAWRLRHDFADGAAFVDLAPLSGATEVPEAIAQAVSLAEAPRRAPLDVVRSQLRERHLLLVLDNLEHVIEAAPQIADLLAACPRLFVLTTSRTPLCIRAEQVFSLDPLDVPEPMADPAKIGDSGAVRLLVTRLQAVQPTFALTGESASHAAEVCRRLDGLPLAIELVASNVAAHNLSDLVGQLESSGLHALENGPRDLPDRQRTLRKALSWSHDRLNADDQRVFAWLGVFSGSFSESAAAAVIDAPVSLTPTLRRLRSMSFLRPHPAEPDERFVWLETLRAFALEHLAARGENQLAQRRHAEWVLARAREAAERLDGPDQAVWFDRLAHDHANAQAALNWSAAHDRRLGLELSTALTLFWRSRGHIVTGRGWLGRLLSGEPWADDVYGPALVSASRLAWAHGDVEAARRSAEDALSVCARAENEPAYAEALALLGDLEGRVGEIDSARLHLDEALRLCHEHGLTAGEAEALHFLSRLATTQGDYSRGIELGLESQSLYRRLGNPRKVAGQGLNLGVYAFEQGDYATALRLTTESLAVFRQLGDLSGIAIALLNLGNSQRETGNLKGAHQSLTEAVAIERQRQGRALPAALGALGEVQLADGDSDARASFAESLQLRLRSGDANGLALMFELFGRWHYRAGRADPAARLIGAAEALRNTTGASLRPNRRAGHAAFLERVRKTLGNAAYDAAVTAGRALGREQAAALALSE